MGSILWSVKHKFSIFFSAIHHPNNRSENISIFSWSFFSLGGGGGGGGDLW